MQDDASRYAVRLGPTRLKIGPMGTPQELARTGKALPPPEIVVSKVRCIGKRVHIFPKGHDTVVLPSERPLRTAPLS